MQWRVFINCAAGNASPTLFRFPKNQRYFVCIANSTRDRHAFRRHPRDYQSGLSHQAGRQNTALMSSSGAKIEPGKFQCASLWSMNLQENCCSHFASWRHWWIQAFSFHRQTHTKLSYLTVSNISPWNGGSVSTKPLLGNCLRPKFKRQNGYSRPSIQNVKQTLL